MWYYTMRNILLYGLRINPWKSSISHGCQQWLIPLLGLKNVNFMYTGNGGDRIFGGGGDISQHLYTFHKYKGKFPSIIFKIPALFNDLFYF